MQLDTFLTVLSWTTPPIVGAVIGYATNWIAIKMLFRPLRAKYLFGWRLPLTPGVIPRNRKQLAASIGEVVGEKLLSEEAIRKHANDPKFRGVVDGMIPRLLRPALRPLIEPLIRRIIVTLRSRIGAEKFIEDQVNQYDVKDLENQIRGVTQQHLKWISWFGALLGALIGCLQLVLNVLI